MRIPVFGNKSDTGIFWLYERERKERKMGKFFGTDGFRGEANGDLTVERAYKVGRFLGWHYGRNPKGE